MPPAPTPDDALGERLELARSAWRILISARGVIDRGSLGTELGVSRQRAYQLAKQPGFPAPIRTRMQARELWLTAEIDAYRNRPRSTAARNTQRAAPSSNPVEVAQVAWRTLHSAGGLIDRPAIAAELGVSNRRVHIITSRRGFPPPAGHAGAVAYWLTAELEQYQRSTLKP